MENISSAAVFAAKDISTANATSCCSPATTPFHVSVYTYDQDSVTLNVVTDALASLQDYLKQSKKFWVVVTGTLDAEKVQTLFQALAINTKSAAHLLDAQDILPRVHFRTSEQLELNHILIMLVQYNAKQIFISLLNFCFYFYRIHRIS